MDSNNPLLKEDAYRQERAAGVGEPMTMTGTINKTILLVVLCALAAGLSWNRLSESGTESSGLIFVGAIGGLIVALVTVFKKSWSPVTAPLYAVLEGTVLGAISIFFEKAYPGIVFQAVTLTFGILFALLIAYRSGMIKVTDRFRLGVVAATAGVCICYLVDWILSYFGHSVPFIHQTGTVGIVFSLAVVLLASMNLVLDFDFIERASQSGAPKYMEWYSGFSVLVTLVWLYMEVLRLLGKTRRR